MTDKLYGEGLTLADAFRFAKFVDVKGISECWNFTGAKSGGTYGGFKIGGKAGSVEQSHRIAYAIHNGPFPIEKHVLHTCDNPLCCNPTHLFLGTHRENMADMTIKGRNKTLRPGNGRRKIDETEYANIADMIIGGANLSEIARRYGVAQPTIRAIGRKTGVRS